MNTPPKPKRGRPRKAGPDGPRTQEPKTRKVSRTAADDAADPITPARLRGLARIGCTWEQAAAAMDISMHLLWDYMASPEFREAWDRGKLQQIVKIHQLTWMYAESITPAGAQVLLHLRRHLLGERERFDFNIDKMSDTQIAEFTKATLAHLDDRRAKDLALMNGKNSPINPDTKH